jgi:hypothetical protein
VPFTECCCEGHRTDEGIAGAWEVWKRIARTIFVRKRERNKHFGDLDIDGSVINMDLRDMAGDVAVVCPPGIYTENCRFRKS